jgi:hypothetical protein
MLKRLPGLLLVSFQFPFGALKPCFFIDQRAVEGAYRVLDALHGADRIFGIQVAFIQARATDECFRQGVGLVEKA